MRDRAERQPLGEDAGRAAGPVSREELRLPEPARTLWARIRDPLKAALATPSGPGPKLRLGGGTILAARWRHRKSRDIDIVTRRSFALWKQSEGLNGVMRSLGAEACGYNAKRRQYRAAFHVGNESQTVEIWPHEPQPRGAERETDVDGGVEIVLATSQILKGKLERGEDALPRDLLDVITAARRARPATVAELCRMMARRATPAGRARSRRAPAHRVAADGQVSGSGLAPGGGACQAVAAGRTCRAISLPRSRSIVAMSYWPWSPSQNRAPLPK